MNWVISWRTIDWRLTNNSEMIELGCWLRASHSSIWRWAFGKRRDNNNNRTQLSTRIGCTSTANRPSVQLLLLLGYSTLKHTQNVSLVSHRQMRLRSHFSSALANLISTLFTHPLFVTRAAVHLRFALAVLNFANANLSLRQFRLPPRKMLVTRYAVNRNTLVLVQRVLRLWEQPFRWHNHFKVNIIHIS